MVARWLVVAGVAAALAVGAGCSSDDPSEPSTHGPSLSASPAVSPGAAAERDALAAYRGMWAAFVEAGKVSDPDAPDLRKYASDQALRLIVSSLYTDREQGKITKGDLVLNPTVSEVKPPQTPTEATVLDCVDSNNWLKYKASGGLVDDVPGGKHRTTATVKFADATWKVSSFILEESGTC